MPQCIDKQPIRCIADGVVVAYRLNKVYKESTYNQEASGFENLTLSYSSSFCLVKHEHKSISSRDPEEEVDTTVIWVGKYFILKQDRTVTDKSTLEEKDADFVGTLKTGSKIKVLEVEEIVKTKDNKNYKLAKVEIISMPQNANIVITKPTKDSNQAFEALNNTVYIAIFDDQSEMVFINDKSVIEEYIPKESWIGKTVKLSTDVIGTYRYLETSLTINKILKRVLSPTTVTPATQPTSEDSVEVKYEVTLPKGLQIKIISVNETKADVQITRPLTGKLIKKPTGSEAQEEFTISTGKTITIELFKNNEKEQFVTYAVKVPSKSDILEPIVETATDEASWNDQTVILYQDTQAREINSETLVTLPEGTKLKNIEKSTQEANTTFSKARLVNDTNVSANGKITTIAANTELYVDLMDQYGNVKQNEDDKENVIAKTPNNTPACNTLIYYSLYMHLLPGELYTADHTLPNYYTKGKITARVRLNGLQTYGNDQARTQGAKIQANGELTYDPSITETITKDNNTLLVTQCTFVSGTFATNTTLKENEVFWAVIDDKSVKKIKISPPDSDEVIDNCNIVIKEGDPIGYLGLYQTPTRKLPLSGISPLASTIEQTTSPVTIPTTLENITQSKVMKKMEFEVSSKSQLHLEIFVTDKKQLENFMQNKAQIKTGNQYLKLSPGAIITQSQSQEAATSTTNQSGAENNSPPATAVETTYALTQEHVLPIPPEKVEDLWCVVDVMDNNQPIKGRIQKGALYTKVLTNHDWQELGFTIVEEQNDNADGFVDKSNMTPFFQNLYAQLDDTNNKLSDRAKLQKTLTDQHIRYHWSKLIGYHPTEWQYSESKWSRLDQILKNNTELLRHEKERIATLAFWDKVSEISKTPKVCHIHPVALFEYAPFALEKSDDGVVVITGKIKEVKKLTDNNDNYGKEIMLYKVLIYNDISYDNYLKYEKEGVLPKPVVTALTRDAWYNKNSNRVKGKRYGRSNETPPGTYWLLYYPNPSLLSIKGYPFQITDTVGSDIINGPDGNRGQIRIHWYNSFYSEGCFTTGFMDRKSIDVFKKKILFFANELTEIKSMRIIIKPRKAIAFRDGKMYTGYDK